MFLGLKPSKFAGAQVTSIDGKAVSALALAVAAFAMPAKASVIDRPYFKASSIVIVFGADDFEENGGVAPIVYDFVRAAPNIGCQ